MTSAWQPLSIPDVWVRSLDRFEDARGENVVLYDGDDLPPGVRLGLDDGSAFVHDNLSVSYRGVVRGLHTDEEAWRLMTCLVGHVHFVVVDCRPGGIFAQSETLVLSDKTRTQMLVPPMVSVGFAVMSPTAAIHYKWSLPYDLARQRTYAYNDASFQIAWPFAHPILSERDRVGD